MGRARPRRAAAPAGRSAEHSPRGRSVAPAARRRAHRPVPDALARRGRHSTRRLLGHTPAAEGGREGPRRRALQSRFRAARSSGAARTRGHAAAAVFGDPPGGRGSGAPVVRRAPYGGHRVQPDAVGPPHGHLQRHARDPTRRGRLALPLSRFHRSGATPESGPGGRAAADRGATRRDCRRSGRRLDARLARRERRDRARAIPSAGGRLDRRREPRPDRGRPERGGCGDPPQRRGQRAGPAVTAMRVVGRRALALAIVLASWLPGTGWSQQVDSAALGPRLSLETVVARTLAYSPGVTGALGAVRDAAALRRVALGAYLPSLSLISS